MYTTNSSHASGFPISSQNILGVTYIYSHLVVFDCHCRVFIAVCQKLQQIAGSISECRILKRCRCREIIQGGMKIRSQPLSNGRIVKFTKNTEQLTNLSRNQVQRSTTSDGPIVRRNANYETTFTLELRLVHLCSISLHVLTSMYHNQLLENRCLKPVPSCSPRVKRSCCSVFGFVMFHRTHISTYISQWQPDLHGLYAIYRQYVTAVIP